MMMHHDKMEKLDGHNHSIAWMVHSPPPIFHQISMMIHSSFGFTCCVHSNVAYARVCEDRNGETQIGIQRIILVVYHVIPC
jgi:hypothetical protein